MRRRERGFVDEVDGLVGELPGGDVAIRQHRGRDECGVLDADTVVDLVALLEPAQDRDRVLDRRFADVHLLEAALERGVLLDVLAVLVERRRADEPQLTARQHRLDHVARVDRTFGTTRADERVDLVDERDDLAFGVGDLLEHGLEPLLELAAVLRAGDHRADVERDHALVAQALGHVAFDDAAREPFDDRGLAHTRLADEHGVVLRATGQHLDDAADLFVAADDGVDLAGARGLGEVAAVLLQCLVLLFRVVTRDAVRPAHLLQRVEHGVVRDAHAAQHIADAAGHVGHGEQHVLAREVLVVELSSRLVGFFQQTEGLGCELRVAHGRTAHARLPLELLVDAGPQGREVDADPFDHPGDDPFGLVEERAQEVQRRHFGVPGVARTRLRGAERFLGLACESVGVECHLQCPLLTTTAGFETNDGSGMARHEVAPVLLANAFDAPFHFLAHRVDARFQLRDATARAAELLFEPEDALHAGEAHAVTAQFLDAAQQLDVALRVPTTAPARARGLDQALALVDAQRLRVHPCELGRDRDHVQRPAVSVHRTPPAPRRANSAARG